MSENKITKPRVAIACQAYNQVNYIRQALDGFLMQKTKFSFVVYVGDDCSTDGTREVIEEYTEKYPEIIKPVFQEQNTYGAGNFKDTFEKCDTEYVAWCEGDDYWTDPYKLQKQVDFLDEHPDFSLCFHYVKVVYENSEQKDGIYPKKKSIYNRREISFEDLLRKNYIQTNSVMYRWRFKTGNVLEYFPLGVLPGDWYLHLLHAKAGRIGFIPEVMSVYRKHSGGIWFGIDNALEHNNKYGLNKISFYNNVYKNITDCSEKYFKEKLVPEVQSILYSYYSSGNYEMLCAVKNDYKELLDKILPDTYAKNLKIKKDKYKHLFNVFLCLFCVSFLINVCFIFIIIVQFIIEKGL